eukprot:TRINITY_DN16624_c0_g1_i5.p2 TRINITY_DN16624_c0_g1~~TRINITY_DN16624_c0_g1_i5.p2  ORF type:complete len:142 (-),score=5.21 TRINITY_DN16624_c0_g1_i5:143-568(-)
MTLLFLRRECSCPVHLLFSREGERGEGGGNLALPSPAPATSPSPSGGGLGPVLVTRVLILERSIERCLKFLLLAGSFIHIIVDAHDHLGAAASTANLPLLAATLSPRTATLVALPLGAARAGDWHCGNVIQRIVGGSSSLI